MKTSFKTYLAFKCPKIGPENTLKIHIDLKGDGDFYFKGRIFMKISINPESMNPRLPCDLYEPRTCIFHPLLSRVLWIAYEGSVSAKSTKSYIAV